MNEPFTDSWKFIPRMKNPHVVWSGHIERIEEDMLILRMTDPADPLDFYMEYPIDKVPEEERQYIEPGRILYIAIGQDADNKPDQHFEFAKFPDLTPEQIEAAKKQAEEWMRDINWE